MDNRPFKNAVIKAIEEHKACDSDLQISRFGSISATAILRARIEAKIQEEQVSIAGFRFAHLVSTACMMGDHAGAIQYTESLPEYAPSQRAIGLFKAVLLVTSVALAVGLILLFV